MKRKGMFLLVAGLAVVIMLSGCSDEVDRAINMLGDESTQEEAMGMISISPSDPMPKLVKALKNKKLSPIAREKVAFMIGVQSEKTDSEEAVLALEEALGYSEENVQIAILGALENIPGDKSIKALQTAMDSDVEVVAGQALKMLDSKALENVSKADKMFGAESLATQISLMQDAVETSPRNRKFRLKLAAYYEMDGQNENAVEMYDAEGGYVREIKVLGPLPMKSNIQVDPAQIDFSNSYEVSPGVSVSWFDFKNVPPGGVIDFRKDGLTRVSESLFYASFAIVPDNGGDFVIKFYTKDRAKIWVNGEAQKLSKENKLDDEYVMPVSLKPGANRVLLMLGSKKYPRFSFRVSTSDGKKIEGPGYEL
ncbi:MAG TPA: HEAT repeat domain-containing protein [bacterium]|nr:HEAT repeat domain-containing protein [bacterium]